MSSSEGMPFTLDDARRTVDELFCTPGSRYGGAEGWTRAKPSEREDLFPGTLYRFVLRSKKLDTVRLQLYCGLSDLGGQLWAREVRVLHRLAVRQHTAMPVLRRAAFDEDAKCGFVMTDRVVQSLATPGAMQDLQNNRVTALRELVRLVEALSLLHGQGLSHRNLGPHAVDLVEIQPDGALEDGPSLRLRLARFEMSDLVSNLLRRLEPQERADHQLVRELYLSLGRDTLAYFPRERLTFLYEKRDEDQLETERSDVYSLGVIAWHWFCGPLPPALLERAFPDSGRTLDVPAFDSLNAYMRSRLTQMAHSGWKPDGDVPWSQAIPVELAEIIRGMLELRTLSRKSSGDVTADLSEKYEHIVNQLQPPTAGTFYVGFMPEESRKTIVKWRLITHDPASEPGRTELQEFHDDELRGATLTYSPSGFVNWGPVVADTVLQQRAKYVLLGAQCAWFCELYHDRWRECDVPNLLLIKFVIQNKERAWQLMNQPLRRTVPQGLEVIPVDNNRFGPDEIESVQDSGGDWTPLLRSVRYDEALPAWHVDLERGLGAVIDWQETELASRIFPYVLISGERRDEVILKYDAARDRTRVLKRAALTLFKSRFQVDMGDLLPFLDSEMGSVRVKVYPGSTAPRRDDTATTIWLTPDSYVNSTEIRVQLERGVILPKEGWLRPADDLSTEVFVQRQRHAVQELMSIRALTAQLHAPSAISVDAARWNDVATDLIGSAQQVIPRLLATQPFFALHGPPGSGKTTVLTRSIEATLRRDPGTRILVSAQSHFALDNLGERIMERFDREELGLLALRLVSDDSLSKVSERMKPHLLDEVTNRTVTRIQAACRHHLEDGDLGEAAREILQAWSAEAPRVRHEIRERLRRGANLVFITSGTATAANLDLGSGVFDWVIVEEAAKAWLTELAIPLARGIRWTLVGDYKQLRAFRRDDFDRWLSACASLQSFNDDAQNTEEESLRTIGARRKELSWVFDFFHHVFEPKAEDEAGASPSVPSGQAGHADRRPIAGRRPTDAPRSAIRASPPPTVHARSERGRLEGPLRNEREPPSGRLDRQFRMREPIARLVGRAFYAEPTAATADGVGGPRLQGTWLQTDPTTEHDSGVVDPPFLRGRAVVWLDTRGIDSCADAGYWSNDGEVQLIELLLQRLRPSASALASTSKEQAIAILAPYRRQVELLQRVDLRGVTRAQIHTVDSFQGREADMVICSLVRDTIRGSTPSSNIGHLLEPNRVNVLLTRARRLLVIVGRFDHYRAAGEHSGPQDATFWGTICSTVEELRARVPATELVGLR